jgi:hypothetical protein
MSHTDRERRRHALQVAAPPYVVKLSRVNWATTRREKCASNGKSVSLHSVFEKASFPGTLTTLRQRSYARESGLFPLLVNLLFLSLVRFPG